MPVRILKKEASICNGFVRGPACAFCMYLHCAKCRFSMRNDSDSKSVFVTDVSGGVWLFSFQSGQCLSAQCFGICQAEKIKGVQLLKDKKRFNGEK